MVNKLQKRLNLSDKDIEVIKKEQSDVVFNKSIIIMIIVVLAISSILQLISGAPYFLVGIFIIIILTFIGIYLYYKEKKEFSLAVKDIIINGLFTEAFEKVLYQPEKGLSESFIKNTGLYPMGNRFYSDDLLSASYKGVGFFQSDVLIQQVTSNGKTTTTTTLFKGRWIVCDFIKNFNGQHQIRSNGFFKNRKPFRFFNDSLDKFQFEDQQFNDDFTTYTTDQSEAYYLINPSYMEKIKYMTNYIGAEVVYGFIDNKLHVAIFNNEDAFEVKGKSIDESFVTRIENDINLIKLIIDGLDLDLDIFK